MSRSAAGDGGVASQDDDDASSLVFVDHVSPAARRASYRLPAPASPAVTDLSLPVLARRTSQNNNRRAGSRSRSPSPLPRLSIANTPLTTPRPAVSRTSSRRKSSAAASQPVSPEPDVHRATSLHRPVGGGSHGVGYRLGRRKVLAERRKRLADYSLLFAMFGVVSMMVEMELTMADLYDKVRRYEYFNPYIGAVLKFIQGHSRCTPWAAFSY